MKNKLIAALLALFVFAIPIEHKYEKPLRFFSKRLIPKGLELPSWFHTKIYFYASDIAAFLLVLLALFLLSISARRLFLKKEAIYLFIIFFCAALSVATSPLASYPTAYFRLPQLLTPIFLFAFLSQAILEEKKSQLTFLLLAALVSAGLFQTIVAIAQYFYQAPLGLRILGESPSITGGFGIHDGSRWIFDRLFHRIAETTDVARSSGTLPHCNVLGGFLALSLLASYALITTAKKRWVRYFLGFSLIAQFFGLSISYSRSALFGWALGTLVWFGFALYHRRWDSPFRFLLLAIALAVLTSGSLLFDQYLHRGGVLNYNSVSRESDNLRIHYQNIAFEMIKDHPLTGVGYHQFAYHSSKYEPPDSPFSGVVSGAHNIYLFLAAETGLISLAAFLLFLATILWRAIRSPFTLPLASLLAMFAALLFIGACDFYPISFQQGRLLLFVTAGLLAVNTTEVNSKIGISLKDAL